MDQPAEEEAGTSDYLFEAMTEHREHVVEGYRLYEDRKPVMLYDIQELRIYAYPYESFKSEMSAKNQASLKDQYERAVADGKMVVFVRDNEARRLVSYTLDYD